jgi:hypothetical protein
MQTCYSLYAAAASFTFETSTLCSTSTSTLALLNMTHESSHNADVAAAPETTSPTHVHSRTYDATAKAATPVLHAHARN